MNFANLEVFANVFLHFLILAGIYIYDIARITKVFSRNMVKKVIRETFLPQMIPDIRYLSRYIFYRCHKFPCWSLLFSTPHLMIVYILAWIRNKGYSNMPHLLIDDALQILWGGWAKDIQDVIELVKVWQKQHTRSRQNHNERWQGPKTTIKI